MVKQITAVATGFKGIVLEDNEAINHTHQTIFLFVFECRMERTL